MAVGPPMLPSFANNSPFNTLVSNYRFIQTADYFVIVHEILHETRIIPLNRRAHVGSDIRSWMGDSLGRWEGNTLVVETTNFIDRAQFRGTGKNMHLVERFTRTGPDTLSYEFTVTDPTTFTRPWTARVPLISSAGPIYEWACHEHNYGLANILSARARRGARRGRVGTKAAIDSRFDLKKVSATAGARPRHEQATPTRRVGVARTTATPNSP